MSPRPAGLPHPDMRRLRVVRSPMVRIAPRLGPAGWHRDVTPQRHSVIEKAPPDPLPGTPRRAPSVVGRTPADSFTDCARNPSARGAPASASVRPSVAAAGLAGRRSPQPPPRVRRPGAVAAAAPLPSTDVSHPAYGPP